MEATADGPSVVRPSHRCRHLRPDHRWTGPHERLGLPAFAPAPAAGQTGPDTIANAFDERPTDAIWQNGHLCWVSTYPVTYDAGATFNDEVVALERDDPGPASCQPAGVAGHRARRRHRRLHGWHRHLAGRHAVRHLLPDRRLPTRSSIFANRVVGGALGTPRSWTPATRAYSRRALGRLRRRGDGSARNRCRLGQPRGRGRGWELADDRRPPDRRHGPADHAGRAGARRTLAPRALGIIPKYRLTWTGATDVSSGAVTYRVEQSVDGGRSSPARPVAGASTVRTLPFGHAYQFRVSAIGLWSGMSGPGDGALRCSRSLFQQTSSTT